MVGIVSSIMLERCLFVLILPVWNYIPVRADESSTFGSIATTETGSENGTFSENVEQILEKNQSISSADNNQTTGNDTFYQHGDLEYQNDFMELLLSLEDGQMSRSTYEDSFRIMGLYIAPGISIPGIVGTVFAVKKALNAPFSDSFRWYITVLFGADIAVLILSIVRSLTAATGLFDLSLHSYIYINYIKFAMPLKHYFMGLCCFLVMFLSIERIIVVARPIKSKTFNLKRAAKTAITISVFINLMLLIQWFDFTVEPYFDTTVNATLYTFSLSQWYIDTRALTTVLLGVLRAVPVVVTLTCNILLIVAASKMLRKRRTLTSDGAQSPRELQENKKNTRMTLMLIYVSFGQIFGYLFTEILFMSYFINPEFNLYMKDHYLLMFFLDVSEILSEFNAANDCLVFVFSKNKCFEKCCNNNK